MRSLSQSASDATQLHEFPAEERRSSFTLFLMVIWKDVLRRLLVKKSITYVVKYFQTLSWKKIKCLNCLYKHF